MAKLKSSKPHLDQVDGHYTIRYGDRVPKDAVSIAYLHTPMLTPIDNVHIADMSNFILENTQQHTPDLSLHVNERQELAGITNNIESEDFLITDVWMSDIPLYFAHKLQHPIYDQQGPDINGYYHGSAITVVDHNGSPLKNPYHWRVKLHPTNATNQYEATVYTSFQALLGTNFQVVYPSHAEVLNPQPAFTRVSSLDECLARTGEAIYYMSPAPTIGHSRVYVPRIPVEDTRPKYSFSWRATLEININGVIHRYETPLVADSVHAANTIMPHEQDITYKNGRKIIYAQPVNTLFNVENNILNHPAAIRRYRIISTNNQVSCDTKLDGSGMAFARVDKFDPLLVGVPEKYIPITINRHINGQNRELTLYSPLFALKPMDRNTVRILPPLDEGDESWHLRIQNGWFTRTIVSPTEATRTYIYRLPEYHRQEFDVKPIKRITQEIPKIIGEHRLKLKYTPLFATNNSDIQVIVNNVTVSVTSYSLTEGIIEVQGTIRPNDKIVVDYYYKETAYTYRGYYDSQKNRFWRLDLNPGVGHLCTILDPADNQIKDVPSFALINRTIYMYIRPIAYTINNTTISLNNHTAIFHTFEELTNTDSLLLAKIYIRTNSRKEDTRFIDTRQRGGGLREKISLKEIKEFQPEAEFYWDIGHWDGKPFPENGVLVVRIPESILKEHGGRFTREEVEATVLKHVSFGVFPIIEYRSEGF